MGATTRASGEDKRRARGYYIKLKKANYYTSFFCISCFYLLYLFKGVNFEINI